MTQATINNKTLLFDLPSGKWKLLGECWKEGEEKKVSFDPEPYLGEYTFDALGPDELWEFSQYCKQAFFSLMGSNGITFDKNTKRVVIQKIS